MLPKADRIKNMGRILSKILNTPYEYVMANYSEGDFHKFLAQENRDTACALYDPNKQ